MTLLDIRNQIIQKLTEDDIINLDNLLDFVKVSKENENIKKELIIASLKDLEEVGIVSKLGSNKLSFIETWVLCQPLNSAGQKIDISMNTANEIAEIINSYLDANKFNGPRADKLNITEMEIIMLLSILGDLLNSDPEKDK